MERINIPPPPNLNEHPSLNDSFDYDSPLGTPVSSVGGSAALNVTQRQQTPLEAGSDATAFLDDEVTPVKPELPSPATDFGDDDAEQTPSPPPPTKTVLPPPPPLAPGFGLPADDAMLNTTLLMPMDESDLSMQGPDTSLPTRLSRRRSNSASERERPSLSSLTPSKRPPPFPSPETLKKARETRKASDGSVSDLRESLHDIMRTAFNTESSLEEDVFKGAKGPRRSSSADDDDDEDALRRSFSETAAASGVRIDITDTPLSPISRLAAAIELPVRTAEDKKDETTTTPAAEEEVETPPPPKPVIPPPPPKEQEPEEDDLDFFAMLNKHKEKETEAAMKWTKEEEEAQDKTPGQDDSGVVGPERWALKFDYLLSSDEGMKQFMKYLRSTFCEENALFWKDSEKLKEVPESELGPELQKIFDKYISPRAPLSLNIDGPTRRIITVSFQSGRPKRDVFAAAQKEIYLLMKFDSYPRFLKSPIYTEHCKNYAKKKEAASSGAAAAGGGKDKDRDDKAARRATKRAGKKDKERDKEKDKDKDKDKEKEKDAGGDKKKSKFFLFSRSNTKHRRDKREGSGALAPEDAPVSPPQRTQSFDAQQSEDGAAAAAAGGSGPMETESHSRTKSMFSSLLARSKSKKAGSPPKSPRGSHSSEGGGMRPRSGSDSRASPRLSPRIFGGRDRSAGLSPLGRGSPLHDTTSNSLSVNLQPTELFRTNSMNESASSSQMLQSGADDLRRTASENTASSVAPVSSVSLQQLRSSSIASINSIDDAVAAEDAILIGVSLPHMSHRRVINAKPGQTLKEAVDSLLERFSLSAQVMNAVAKDSPGEVLNWDMLASELQEQEIELRPAERVMVQLPGGAHSQLPVIGKSSIRSVRWRGGGVDCVFQCGGLKTSC